MTGEAVILAGGMGTRLKDVVADVPKSMATVNGRPFLAYQLDFLEHRGLKRVILSVGYRKEMIRLHFGDRYKSLTLIYAEEEEPLGTGGAILNSLQLVQGNAVFILNGDTYFDVDLEQLEDFRRAKNCHLCLAVKFLKDPARYGLLEIDKDGRITRFHEKSEGPEAGYVNGGVYVVSKDFLLHFGLPEKFSFEKDFLQGYYLTEKFYGMQCSSYFRDIGIPGDYQKANDEFKRLIF